jgi:hypothetical protein
MPCLCLPTTCTPKAKRLSSESGLRFSPTCPMCTQAYDARHGLERIVRT